MKQRGFTLTEILIGLALTLFMFVAAFEFLGITKDLFTKLKDTEEDSQAAAAALEKLRIDLSQAGRGLAGPMRSASIAGLEVAGQTLILSLAEQAYPLANDVLAGQTLVPLVSVSGLGSQREVCLVEGGWSEIHTVAACGSGAVDLSEPLQASFSKTGGRLLLIEKISYFLDTSSGILRRRVNGGSAQPLLEGVEACDLSYDAAVNLAKASLSLKTSKERKYEISFFPKNIGLTLSAY
jgi:prepilin-type N-terminal cleavage/methylation domain-containing protein